MSPASVTHDFYFSLSPFWIDHLEFGNLWKFTLVLDFVMWKTIENIFLFGKDAAFEISNDVSKPHKKSRPKIIIEYL